MRTATFTSLLALLHKSDLSSTSRSLPSCIAVQILFRFVILYAARQIAKPVFALCGFCKHTMLALRSNHLSRAAMVHLFDLAQLCWIGVIMDSQHSCFIPSSSVNHGYSCNVIHRNIFSLTCCLFSVCIRKLHFASSLGFCTSLKPKSDHHSVHSRCHVSCCVHKSPCF